MKIYLDTNVYDYIAKNGISDKFKCFCQKNICDIVVSLGVIYEIARIPDEKLRNECFQVVWELGTIYPKFPESYLETQEIINELKRCRPNWVHPVPHEKKDILAYLENYRLKMKFFRHNHFFETNESFEEYVSLAERAIDIGNPNDKKIRQSYLKYESLEIRANDPEIQMLLTSLPDCERFWRGKSSLIWRQALKGDPSMRDYKDWLLPYLRLTTVDKMDWESFWLKDVNSRNVPRTYIRGLTEYFQLRFRITHGNMEDSNHSLYLVGNQLFLTSDKNYFDVLQKVFGNSTVKIAKPIFIDRNNTDACDEITRAIRMV
jgi:hypothetical protein